MKSFYNIIKAPLIFYLLLLLPSLFIACKKPILTTSHHTYAEGLYKMNTLDYFGAIECFDALIQNDSLNSEAFLKRGFSKGGLKDYKGAITDCNHSLIINPNDGRAYICKGLSNIELNLHQQGCFNLAKAFELGNLNAFHLHKIYCP